MQTLRPLTICLAACLAAPAGAQDERGESLLAEQGRPITYSLRGGAEYQYEAQLSDNTQGDVYIFRLSSVFEAGIPVAERGRVNLTFGSEWSNHEWNGGNLFFGPNVDPFDDVFIYNVGATYSQRQDNHWTWFVGGRVLSSHETGTELTNTLTYGLTGGAIYAVNPDVQIGLGVTASTSLEDDATVWPYPILRWQLDERWSVETTGFDFGSGGGGRLTYRANPELAFTLDGSYDQREFRLDNEDTLPDGVVRDTRIPVWLGVLWSPQPGFSLNARVGVLAFQEFTFENSSGVEAVQMETDATAIGSLSFQWDF